MRFTPTGSSWLNLVKRRFADLTGDCMREGSFQRVRSRIESIEDSLPDRNANPICYVWRAKGEEIFKTFACAKDALEAQSRKLSWHKDSIRINYTSVVQRDVSELWR